MGQYYNKTHHTRGPETNDQFLDRIELERLERQGYEFPELRQEMAKDRYYYRDRYEAICRAISKL